MLKSIWRYSHLVLAVSSFLILTLLSITGIILAFEPISEKTQRYGIKDLNNLEVAHVVPLLKEKYKNVQEISINDHQFVTMNWTNDADEETTSYIDPKTGEILGPVAKQNAFFEWNTNLHRSLFLHQTGRLIVGITAFLLILIAISGIGLIIQRQKGIKNFFASVGSYRDAQFYHVVWGRISLVFILMIAVTGSYLSLSRFVLKPQKPMIEFDTDNLAEDPQIALTDFPLFQNTHLDQVKKIQFPFSEFPEDYYQLELADRVVCVNQFTGDIIQEELNSTAYNLSEWSLRWHTGRNSIIWAVILAISSGYIIFFIISGFIITLKRINGKAKNKFKATDATYIILVGSENGSTFAFANTIFKQLIKQGEKAYISTLDQYEVFPNAIQMILMTATYGDGDAPANATKFIERVKKMPQSHHVNYSVVGFGSRSYDNYCAYAYEVEELMKTSDWAVQQIPIQTVDDKSPQDFNTWLIAWSKSVEKDLVLDEKLFQTDKYRQYKLKVTYTSSLDENNTFIVRMKPISPFVSVTSGDILGIFPAKDYRERLYSIGKVNGEIQLCIKQYNGLGSGYLGNLKVGDTFKGRVIKNTHFHFPKKAPAVLLVSNGTGIAPFLGMIENNSNTVETHLYCGFKTASALVHYKDGLDAEISEGKLSRYRVALSREGEMQYVTHQLTEDSDAIWALIERGGIIMLCGSIAMQRVVMIVLDAICKHHQCTVEQLVERGQIVSDCY